MKDLIIKFFEEQGFFVDFENQIEPDDEVNTQKREKVIGEMNDMEKGLYSFLSMKEKEHNELITKMQEADKADNYETLGKLEREHKKNHRVGGLAKEIMWASVHLRFENSKDATGKGIRKGFKIVETFEDNNPSVSGMMIPGLGMMISIER